MRFSTYDMMQISETENNSADFASSDTGGSIEGAKLHLWMGLSSHQYLYQSLFFTGVFPRLAGRVNVLQVA